MSPLLKRFATITMIASLIGCATVDFDYPKQESVVIKGTATPTWASSSKA